MYSLDTPQLPADGAHGAGGESQSLNLTFQCNLIDPGLSGAEENCQVLTRIVSVFSKTVKNRLMSTGLNVTLKHLWPHSETELTKVRDSVTVT